jgi:AmmeMemoRadiSam system protein A
VEATVPLWQSVRDNAVASAFHDPRFPALSREEFEQVKIEISALTPLRKVSSIDEIELGRHGLMITRGPRRGLLLPQVPTEHGWDLLTFLEHTCRKAMLPYRCWEHPDSKLQTFTAEVFSEER